MLGRFDVVSGTPEYPTRSRKIISEALESAVLIYEQIDHCSSSLVISPSIRRDQPISTHALVPLPRCRPQVSNFFFIMPSNRIVLRAGFSLLEERFAFT